MTDIKDQENFGLERLDSNCEFVSEPEVLYVTGCGRSGSTILDTLLGTLDGVSSFGELRCLPSAVLSEKEYCACGALVSQCPFWSKVLNLVRDQYSDFDLERLLWLQRRVENLGFPPMQRCKEWSEYGRHQVAVFKALAQITGSRLLVDSSKLPSRALALGRTNGVRLRILHLVRDARGVAWSLSKAYAKNARSGIQRAILGRSTFNSTLLWQWKNLQSTWVTRRVSQTKILRFRYEDLSEARSKRVTALSGFIEVPETEVASRLEGERMLTVGHTVAGNRLRMQRTVKVAVDESWKTDMPASDKAWCTLLASPLLARYGYLAG